MPQSEKFEVLVLGSGTGGKLIAWHMAQSGHKTAVVERRWIGGACPNIACMPSKNEIASARVAHLARHGREYGAVTGSVTVDMAIVRQRKRAMVERQVAKHLQIYKTSGAELIMGSGRFVAPKTVEVMLSDGRTRVLVVDKVFLNLGTHAAIPNIPGLEAAQPLTHIEALELDYLPQHLIVIGGGYSGLELAQAYRRFGSEVTVFEAGPQIMAREDVDVAREMRRLLGNEGINVLVEAQLIEVRGRSGDKVALTVRTPSGEQNIDGSDILAAVGRILIARVATLPMDAVLGAQATDQTQGFMKALIGDNDDRILGFTMIGAAAGEVMAAVQTAMLAGLSYTSLANAAFAHPTMAEGLSSLFSNVPPRAERLMSKVA